MTGSGGGSGSGRSTGAAAMAAKYPYAPGSVLRVRMHNFLTYSDAEVIPGPRLNMVVGPNGSGKSTILCAISLGVGNRPGALERGGQLGDFVMRDKEKGWVELTLKGKKGGEDVTIRRDLERGTDRSKWRVNGEPATMASVQQRIKDMGIDVNNLCTFLPQEKVGKFTEMNAQQLLEETERSITNTNINLYGTHMKLVEMQGAMQTSDKDRNTAVKDLEKKEAELETLARSKQQMEERTNLLRKAAVYDKVAASLVYNLHRLKGKRLQIERDALDEQRKAAQQSQEPYQRRVQKYKEDVAAANKALNRSDAAYDAAKAAVAAASKEVEEGKHDDLQRAKDALASVAREREALQRRRAEIQKQLDAAIHARDNLNVDELKERSAAVATRLRKAKQEHDALLGDLKNAQGEHKEAEREEADAKKTLTQLNDRKRQQLYSLANARGKFQDGGDAAKAYQWVRTHQDRFHGRVYGPIAMELSIDTPEHAAMVENQCMGHVLLSFVVENEHDKALILRECKDNQKLRITVTLLPDRWEQEVNKEYYSEADLAKLRGSGITGVMESFVQAPPQVKAALRNHSNLHRVLIGDHRAEQRVGQNDLMAELCTMGASGLLAQGFGGGGGGDDDERKGNAVLYTRQQGAQGGIVNHRATVSRYSGEVSTQSKLVHPKAQVLGVAGADYEERVARAKRDLDEIHARMTELQRVIQDVQEKEEAAGTQRTKFEKESKKLKADISLAGQAKEKVKRLTEQLAAVEAQLETDVSAQRAELQRKTQEAARALVDAVVNMGAKVEGLASALADRAPPKLAHAAALKLQQAAEREQRNAAAQFRDLVTRFERVEKEYRATIQKLKTQRTEFMQMMGENKEDAAEVDQLTKTTFNPETQKEDGETEEEAIARLQVECEAERDAAREEADRIVDNQEALVQYERVSKEVKALKARLAELQRVCDSGQSGLEREAGPWAEALRNLTAKLHVRFSEYMAQMGCEGRVTLEEERDDYRAWRLQIWVKFRKETTLQPLSAKVHSGGERSVSTILFLMGLQDVLGESPFRAVDEINQGMDERNERLVFSRIVANSTRNQYFLVTPKLLPGLTAMEVDHVTVLFVFNAPELLGFDKWNLQAFLEVARRRALSGGAGGSGGGKGKGKRLRGAGAGEDATDEEEGDEEGKGDDEEGKARGGKKRRSEGEAARA